MADQPYIQWWTSDFLNGVMDLSAEAIGVYAVVLNLIADKGSPIDDDAQWIARRTGCKNTRHANRILNQLCDAGKLERRAGLIGNDRMLREVRRRGAKSNQAREAANERWRRWRAENKPQLPLAEEKNAIPPDKPPAENEAKNTPKNGIYSESNRNLTGQKNTRKNSGESQNSANSDMRTHPDSRARANPEPESYKQPSRETNEGTAREAESDDRSADSDLDSGTDLTRLLERVSEAAGFVPRGANRYAESIDLVKGWRDAGLDFDATVLPTIRRMLRESNHEPTNSLVRFDRAVRHEHAKTAAHRANGSKPAPPQPDPILLLPGEDPSIQPVREAILEAIGVPAYTRILHRFTLEGEIQPNGQNVLFAFRDPRCPYELLDDDRIHLIPRIARQHGFHDVWEKLMRGPSRMDTGPPGASRSNARDTESNG